MNTVVFIHTCIINRSKAHDRIQHVVVFLETTEVASDCWSWGKVHGGARGGGPLSETQLIGAFAAFFVFHPIFRDRVRGRGGLGQSLEARPKKIGRKFRPNLARLWPEFTLNGFNNPHPNPISNPNCNPVPNQKLPTLTWSRHAVQHTSCPSSVGMVRMLVN